MAHFRHVLHNNDVKCWSVLCFNRCTGISLFLNTEMCVEAAVCLAACFLVQGTACKYIPTRSSASDLFPTLPATENIADALRGCV